MKKKTQAISITVGVEIRSDPQRQAKKTEPVVDLTKGISSPSGLPRGYDALRMADGWNLTRNGYLIGFLRDERGWNKQCVENLCLLLDRRLD